MGLIEPNANLLTKCIKIPTLKMMSQNIYPLIDWSHHPGSFDPIANSIEYGISDLKRTI